MHPLDIVKTRYSKEGFIISLRTVQWFAGFVLPVLVVATSIGCNQADTHTNQELPNLSETDLSKGIVAPAFTIISYPAQSGKPQNEVSLRDFEGTPLILNFWAGSCPPCRAEMPDFEALHEERANQLTIIGIDVGQFSGLGTPEQAEELINQVGVTYLTGYALSPDIMKDYKVISMPTTIFVNSEGVIVREWSGMIDRPTLFDLAEALISRS